MKKLWLEFKKFISKGSVMDLAVGTIIGAAFTTIVSALSNGILKPIINWVIYLLVGSQNADEMYTILVKATDSTGNIDLANSIYIDWGAFISAIINFFLVALVLFWIVKGFNKLKDMESDIKNIDIRIEKKLKLGLPLTQKEVKRQEEVAALKEKAAQEKAAQAAQEAQKVTTEQLLSQILEELKNQNQNK